ncbi:MAG: hypothetical protein NTV50_09915, partial [Planctomycetota bacterium]|nr:hypothetical protein [Planctomycetota bacterium]
MVPNAVYKRQKKTHLPPTIMSAQASSLLTQKAKVSPSKHKKTTSYMAPQNPLHGTPKPATWHP